MLKESIHVATFATKQKYFFWVPPLFVLTVVCNTPLTEYINHLPVKGYG